MSNAEELVGKHAVVTGGGRGIGAAIASELSRFGARVTLIGRDEETLAAHAATLPSSTAWKSVDVTDHEAVVAAFEAIGTVDILINNAGSAPSAPFARLSVEDWRHTQSINLDAVFYCTQQVIGSMLANDYGRIINIASTSSMKGYAYVAAYCAAKHGVLGLTRALAVEYARKNITVNAVCPGFTETDLLTGAIDNIMQTTGRDEDKARAALYASNPQQRFIQPQEVASTVAWLLHSQSSSVTGQAIAVCGGEVM